MIEEGEIIKWRNFKIERKLHGSAVFNDFIQIFSIFLIAKDFSEKLKKIDDG